MKVVVDTNVLVSGMFDKKSNCLDIMGLIFNGELELHFNTAMMIEYESVLKRSKFKFEPGRIAILLDFIENEGSLVSGLSLPPLKDPKDTAFLEAAVSGRCQYLVTGNLKHFPKDHYEALSIVSPAEFLTRYRSR